jgi:hypothetical protein
MKRKLNNYFNGKKIDDSLLDELEDLEEYDITKEKTQRRVKFFSDEYYVPSTSKKKKSDN